jgi:hypothetical protein
MSDKDRIHRWITQAELDRMLADAYRKGAEAMREAAAQEMFRLRDRYNERINVIQMIGAEVPDHLGIAREEAGCHMDIIRALPLPEGRR